jgi:hypothetical protein
LDNKSEAVTEGEKKEKAGKKRIVCTEVREIS